MKTDMATLDRVQAAFRREMAAREAYDHRLLEFEAMAPKGSGVRLPALSPAAAVMGTPEAIEYETASADLARLLRQTATQFGAERT